MMKFLTLVMNTCTGSPRLLRSFVMTGFLQASLRPLVKGAAIQLVISCCLISSLFAGDKPLNGIVIKDLPILDKTVQDTHPVKKLQKELANEESSGEQQVLSQKLEADRIEKEAAKKSKKKSYRTEESIKKR